VNSLKLLQKSSILIVLSSLLALTAEGKKATPLVAKPVQTGLSTKNESKTSRDFYDLTFPPGPALAQILWFTQKEGSSKTAKERVLARGKVRLPKNVLFEVVLST
jgi:hypothetical protein